MAHPVPLPHPSPPANPSLSIFFARASSHMQAIT